MRRSWLILLVAWLGWVFDIMDSSLFNFAKLPMLEQMMGKGANTGPVDGAIQMVFIFGWAIGGLIFGVLADRWGRGRTMVVTILLYCIFTGLTGLCQTPEQVIVIRFLTALGIGGEWAAGAALIAESFTDRQRPIAAAILQTAAAFGPWFAALINIGILKAHKDAILPAAFQPWQYLFFVGVIPALIVVLIRVVVKDEAHSVRTERPPNPVRELFSRPDLLKRVVMVMLIGTIGISGATTASYWIPNLVKEASQGLSASDVGVRVSTITLIQHVGTLAGVFFFPWLAKRVGRRAAIGAGFILALGVFWFGLKAKPSYEEFKLLAPCFAFAAIGVTAVFGLYFPELFPSSVRATGAGLGYNTARILSAPIPWLTGILIGQEKGAVAVGVAVASTIYILGIVILPLATETKDQPLPD